MSDQEPTPTNPEPPKPDPAPARPERVHHGTGFGGVILVLLGLLFLGLNYGWWGIDVWAVVWRLWPVLIILLGLRILLPRHRLYSWLMLAVTLAVFALAVAAPPSWLGRTMMYPAPTTNQTLAADLGSTKQLKLTLDIGAADITIKPLPATSAQLYQASFTNTPGVTKTSDTAAATTTVTLSERGHAMMPFWGQGKRQVTLYLSPNVPLDLTLDIGAAQLTADLSALQLQNLTLHGGASSLSLKFGRLTDHLAATINAGASSITLQTPKDTATQVRYSGGLSSQNFEAAGLQKDGDTYRTSDYANATRQINIQLDAGASSVGLERYE